MTNYPRKPCPYCGQMAYGNDRTLRGYHRACSKAAQMEALRQMHEKSGPIYERYLSRNKIIKAARITIEGKTS